MKEIISIEKTKNKVIVTYFNGEFSEWIYGSKDGRMGDKSELLEIADLTFKILADLLDKKVRALMIEAGTEIEKMGIGKHLFKYDK